VLPKVLTYSVVGLDGQLVEVKVLFRAGGGTRVQAGEN